MVLLTVDAAYQPTVFIMLDDLCINRTHGRVTAGSRYTVALVSAQIIETYLYYLWSQSVPSPAFNHSKVWKTNA